MTERKYDYLHVVQGYYGHRYGWEDLTQSESWKEARDDARAYRENDSAPIRIIRRRELRKSDERILEQEHEDRMELLGQPRTLRPWPRDCEVTS